MGSHSQAGITLSENFFDKFRYIKRVSGRPLVFPPLVSDQKC
jgi:hypothetical protein